VFDTKRRHYVYDTNTGEIIHCDPISIAIIQSLGRSDWKECIGKLIQENGSECVLEHLEQLIALAVDRTPPVFSTEVPEETRYCLDPDTFKYQIAHRLEQMTVSLTDICNMACRYCIYSGKYASRSARGNHVMSKEVLQSSMDYFIEHSKENEMRCFGFYGGEPTLASNLIRYACNYLSDNLDRRRCIFSITTNLVDIDAEMLSLLRDNGFLLSISLDGPKPVHDRYRVRANGRGTFDRVIDNLRRLKNLDEDYYHRNVTFDSTIAPPYRLLELRDFFENWDLLPASTSRIRANFVESPLVAFENCPSVFFDDSSIVRFHEDYLDLARRGALNQSDSHHFLRALFDRDFFLVYRRNRLNQPLSEVISPGGICLPGKRKVYVRWDGTFLPCEKVPEYRSLCIGDYHRGVDVEKAYRLCQDFVRMSADDCRHCWAILLCNQICFGHAFDDDGPALEKKKEQCEAFRVHVSERLTDMCSVLEDNPRAFDYMNQGIIK
jgi:uncharacterized protein